MREDIQRISRNGIGEVRDDSNAGPGIRDFVCRCINGCRGKGKSRGKVRM
jgi:hypothetical protein